MVLGKKELSVILLAVAAIVFYLVLLSTTPSGAQEGEETTGIRTTSQNGDDLSCLNDEETVTTFSGSDDTTTDTFEITGDEWCFVVEATATTDSSGNVSVTTASDLDTPGFGSAFVSVDPEFFPTESSDSGIIDGPGTFSLEIDANGVDYEIVVRESSDGNGGGGTTGSDPEPTRRIGQGGGGEGRNDPSPGPKPERTIVNVPNRPLPPSGGLPVYGMVAGFVLAGAGLVALGFVIRRSQ